MRELNELARSRLRDAGALSDDVAVQVERGERMLAPGDRVMFLKNERSLRVKNGTLGVLEQAAPQRLAVRLDDGRSVAFDMKDYAHLDHGYAATVHKAQGVTVDRGHMLAATLGEPGAAAEHDALWQERFGVEIGPNPDLTRSQKAVVAKDYGMEKGSAVLPVR